MRSTILFLALSMIVTTAAACSTDTPEEATFEAVVERVLKPSCTFGSCHAAAPKNIANLDLTPAAACSALVNKPSCLFPDRMRVVPGSPETSFFFHKLSGDGLHEMPTGDCSTSETPTNLLMPYGASALADADLELVHNWIANGANCTPADGPITPGAPAIASLTANRTRALAGETFAVTITLDQPAPEGGQVVTFEWESDALSAPVQVTVGATTTTARFDAFAMRPTSRFTLRAHVGQSNKELVLRIAGLEIAEVLADPNGADDGQQWIKIHNRSAMEIDLAPYKLKAGQGNYDAIIVDLVGSLAPGACAVIGGPAQSTINGAPMFSQVVNFSPDLPHSGGQATGFAVFDGTARPVSGVATPVDTMLVGSNNVAQLRGPDAEVANPFCSTPVAGTSARRTGPGSCSQAVMQPQACQ